MLQFKHKHITGNTY